MTIISSVLVDDLIQLVNVFCVDSAAYQPLKGTYDTTSLVQPLTTGQKLTSQDNNAVLLQFLSVPITHWALVQASTRQKKAVNTVTNKQSTNVVSKTITPKSKLLCNEQT